jgi:hypothetical protein
MSEITPEDIPGNLEIQHANGNEMDRKVGE